MTLNIGDACRLCDAARELANRLLEDGATFDAMTVEALRLSLQAASDELHRGAGAESEMAVSLAAAPVAQPAEKAAKHRHEYGADGRCACGARKRGRKAKADPGNPVLQAADLFNGQMGEGS